MPDFAERGVDAQQCGHEHVRVLAAGASPPVSFVKLGLAPDASQDQRVSHSIVEDRVGEGKEWEGRGAQALGQGRVVECSRCRDSCCWL